MADFDPADYSDVALFNTKAVVQETGVTAATLRAWERRYGLPEPERTESNYRLYSERDIALIRWLRDRVEGGMAISQAVELYRRLAQGQETPSHLPGVERSPAPSLTSHQRHDISSVQAALLEAFKAFDEQRAERLLSDSFALYPLEQVLGEVVVPAMVEVGEQWHRGDLAIAVEHFATAYVERKVMALMNAQPANLDGPLVVTGCAPHEHHELGILLFSLFLRRQGMRVVYLGQNVPKVDLSGVIEALHPAMLALSAMGEESAQEMAAVAELIAQQEPPRPIFAFGGGAFHANPALAESLSGLWLGPDAQEAARRAVQAIRQRA